MFTRTSSKELLQRLREAQLLFIQAVIGPRQVGKSTALEQIECSWDGPTIMASGDSPAPFDAEWIRTKWLEARAKRGEKIVLLVLDEIQKVSGWSEVVKKMFDEDRKKNDLRVVILGSSHLTMDKGLSESLTGRFESFPMHHWSALECHDAFGWNLEQYLSFGGYPAAASLINTPLRWQRFIRDSIIEPVLSRDIMLLERVKNPALLRQTLLLALQSPAQVLSFNKMLGQLQERGNASTIKGYLELLEKAFLLVLVYRYSAGPIATRTSSPKLIPLCPALMHAFTDPTRIQSDREHRGHVIEAAVGAKLSSSPWRLFYWSEGNFEVDFVLEQENKLLAIEVKSGRSKKAVSLSRFNRKYPNAKTLILEGAMLEEFLMQDGFRIIEEAFEFEK